MLCPTLYQSRLGCFEIPIFSKRSLLTISIPIPEQLIDGDGHGLRHRLHPHPHPLGVLRLVLACAGQQLLRLHARQVRRRGPRVGHVYPGLLPRALRPSAEEVGSPFLLHVPLLYKGWDLGDSLTGMTSSTFVCASVRARRTLGTGACMSR